MASHLDRGHLGDYPESVLGARARHCVLRGRGRGGIGVPPALTHGSWAAAAAANPLAYLAAGLATATAPVLVARAAGRGAAPRAWSAAARRRAHWAVAVVVALSWVFQLHRFGFL